MEPHQCADTSHGPISSAQTLCQRCRDIEFGRMIPSKRKSSPQMFRLGSASEIVMDNACCMCQMLDQTFQQRKFYVTGQSYYLYPFYTSQIHAQKWLYCSKREGISDTVSFAIVADMDVEQLQQGDVWGMKDTIKRCGWISPLPDSPPSPSFTPRKLDLWVDFDVLRGWLGFCTLNHRNTCHGVPERGILPIKLIDCVSRTIVTAVPGYSYVTLSYVWGSSSTAPLDDPCNAYRDRLSGPLPNVVEDAIIATEKLGFRYLWIDRYCINQWDKTHREAQIQQMDLIYSLASCTIVAAAGRDPTDGLPGVWTTERKARLSATTRDGCYISVPPDPLSKIETSTWNSRGWTFQEATLSRRCITFCDDQVYFTCGAMTCRDAIDAPLTALHRKNLERFSAWNDGWDGIGNDIMYDDRLFKPILSVRNPFHEFSKLIQTYTKRSMSDPNDILNGISGVYNRFKSVHPPFRLFHGIIFVPDTTFQGGEEIRNPLKKRIARSSSYTEQLATGLCWDVERSNDLSSSGRRRYGFPSWSWTGWIEQTNTPTEYEGYISNTHGLKIGVEDMCGNVTDWEEHCRRCVTDDELAHVKTHLHIEGSFVSVSLCLSATDPCNTNDPNQSRSAVWWAVLERGDKAVTSAQISLTSEEHEMGKPAYDKVKTVKRLGFILGRRCKTYYAGHLQRTLQPTSSTDLVVMVVTTGFRLVERLGLAVFKPHPYLESIPTWRQCVVLA